MLRFSLLLSLLCLPGSLAAAPPVPGQSVFIKYGAEGRMGINQVVTVKSYIGQPVLRYSGDWQQVGKFWVQSKDVLTADQAIQYYTEQIEAAPSANLWFARACVWEEQEEYDKALKDYAEAIRLDPQDDNKYSKRAILLKLMGKLNEALADWDKAIQLRPDDAFYYGQRGEILLHLRMFDRAVKDFTKALEDEPENMFYYFYCRGRAWLELEDYERAIEDYSETIRLTPESPKPYLSRGEVLEFQGKHEAAMRDYNQAIQLDPKLELAYLYRGRLNSRLGKQDEAIKDFSVVIELLPDDHTAYCQRGIVYYLQKNFEAALADFSKSISLEPGQYHALDGRGRTYVRLGKYQEALRDFTEGIRITSKYPDLYDHRAWLLATCPDKTIRDGKQAVKDATRACELTEWKHPKTLSTLAEACAEADDFENAIKWQHQAIRLAPKEHQEQLQSRLEGYKLGKPFRELVPD